jgi:branched-chain amino acid transport system substrate-binding protein
MHHKSEKYTGFLSLLVAASLLLAACSGFPAGKQTVKISWIGPLTGGNAGIGLGGRNSFELAINQANADPASRYRYQGVYIDDECNPAVAVEAARKAAANPEVIASVSHYCSVTAIATVDIFHNSGLPSIVWGAVLPAVTYGNNYLEVFRVNGTMTHQDDLHAADMKKWGYRTVSVIYDTSDYGRAHLEYFSQAAKREGLQILSAQGVATDQQNFSDELSRIKVEDPDVIFFGGLAPVGIPLRRQMVKMDIKAQFDGTSGIKNNSFNEGLGPDAEGVVAYLDGAPLENLPGGPAFKQAYQKAGYIEPPEAYGPFAFAAAQLVIAAIEKVGPDRARVAGELAKTRDADTIIGKVTFDSHGQNIFPVVTAYVSETDKWVPLDQSSYRQGGPKLLPGIRFMQEKGRRP